MKQLDHYSFGAQDVLDDTQIVLTADRIENMTGREIDRASKLSERRRDGALLDAGIDQFPWVVHLPVTRVQGIFRAFASA